MALLYISEFPGLVQGVSRGAVEMLPMPPIGEQVVAIAAGSTPSVALSKSTTMIRVCSDVICSIVVSRGPPATGVTPTATAAHFRIPANAPPEYLAVCPGSVVAVIANT